MNVLIVGYYNHCNLGDEQYKYSIKHILNHLPNTKPKSIEFIDCDKLDEYVVIDDTVILFGGGDVLNTYFLDKMNEKFKDISPKPKIIAFSVGIPYNSIFLEPANLAKLDIFDHIYLRTKQDIPIFSQFFDEEKLSYLPDASCYLPDAFPNTSLSICIPSKNDIYKKLYNALFSLHKTKKIININLCRHIHHKEEPYKQNYISIVRELARFFEELTNLGYYLVFLPFNTKQTPQHLSDEYNSENDILIANDVLKHMKNHNKILNVDYELSLPEILSLYPFFYMSIPMRFHGTLFSLHASVPMIPIYTTKKIRNILLDIDWKHEYVFEKNSKDLPICFDSKKMMCIFLDCVREHTTGKTLLKTQYQNFKNYYETMNEPLRQTLFNKDNISNKKKIVENQQSTQPICSLNNGEIGSIKNTFNKLQQFAKEHGFDDFRELTDPTLKNIAVCVVSYFLTGLIDSPYNAGIMCKMFSPTYQYGKEWEWVLNHYKTKGDTKEFLPENPNGPFYIGYIDQNDQSGAHRSGWKYVYDNLLPLNNSQAPTLLDLYLDRTFHWKCDIYKEIGIIPYRKPWMGFIHHTFDKTFSEYNSHNLLDCPEFIDSLPTCRGIIVLSQYLKQQFEDEFKKRGIDQCPIYVLTHPMETEVPAFNMETFLSNPDKKIIHIGGWLRNIFSFYQLHLNTKIILHTSLTASTIIEPNKMITNLCSFFQFRKKTKKDVGIFETTIRKVALKGKYMDNYYPCDQFTEKLQKALTCIHGKSNADSKFCSQGGIQNNWVKHMVEYLDTINKKMDILSVVDNKTYDDLLTENLVFINLVDGSAVNTLIECVVRNTPVFVNRHPAVIEIVGEDYPLLYEDANEINILLKNPECIQNAYNHMKKIDKTPYYIAMTHNTLSSSFSGDCASMSRPSHAAKALPISSRVGAS